MARSIAVTGGRTTAKPFQVLYHVVYQITYAWWSGLLTQLLVTSQSQLCMCTLMNSMCALLVEGYTYPAHPFASLIALCIKGWKRGMVRWVDVVFSSLLGWRKESWTCSSNALKSSYWIINPSWAPVGRWIAIKMWNFEPVIFPL